MFFFCLQTVLSSMRNLFFLYVCHRQSCHNFKIPPSHPTAQEISNYDRISSRAKILTHPPLKGKKNPPTVVMRYLGLFWVRRTTCIPDGRGLFACSVLMSAKSSSPCHSKENTHAGRHRVFFPRPQNLVSAKTTFEGKYLNLRDATHVRDRGETSLD